MYLSEIYLENTGPIAKCHVQMPFDPDSDDDSKPLPVVIVGPNGSGKSIFLSYIVDALMEMAKTAFHDIVPSDGARSPYYRIIHKRAIHSGATHSLSLLCFNTTKSDLLYAEKAGRLDANTDYLSDFKSKYASVWNWLLDGNYKKVSDDIEETIKEEMERGVHVFFPASRRESPDWLNQKSIKPESITAASNRMDNELGKPIRVETSTEDTIGWILDVFLDSMVQFKALVPNPGQTTQIDLQNRQALEGAKRNIEQILQAILQDAKAELQLNLRHFAPSRLAIQLGNGQIIPSLNSLSEGQSQLLNLFTTIIRYGERDDLNKSIVLPKIAGVVLIDEIDAHLHPTLQHEVVPRLMKLFPLVQFIVSSHSPLFLLGMEKEFGPNGLKILELPAGRSISSEQFSEFSDTFKYYQDTKNFEEQIERRLKKGTKPLVLTEGKLDAIYIRKALALLEKRHLLEFIDVEPVGVDSKKGDRGGGKSGLDAYMKAYQARPSLLRRPVLLLYDPDAGKRDETTDMLWGRSIPKNCVNTKVKIGIENLFPESLFEKRFYPETQKDDGGSHNDLDKNTFCHFVCDERQNADDFAKFAPVIEMLEEFGQTFQSQ